MRQPVTICPLTCPMINKYGFCESALRRVERVRECPHSRMRRAVARAASKLDTGK